MKDSNLWKLFGWLILGLSVRIWLLPKLEMDNQVAVWGIIILLMIIGVYLIMQTAGVIEKTTGVLKDRTGIAGGLLQALGTAFPDMVIGVVSAILSLQAASTDMTRSINLAIIAASTTFGSNIYNILHAAWCVHRQNLADKLNKQVKMFPGLTWGGMLKPLNTHKLKPAMVEINAAMEILVYLAFLTLIVAMGMVLFGRVSDGNILNLFNSDLYALSKPIAAIVLIISVAIIYIFRKAHAKNEKEGEENYYFNKSQLRIWFDLLISGFIILLAAESLVESIAKFSEMSGIPYVITGIATALVGCLGEMIVIHNFSIHPKGRLADAITGVVMDNVVTIIGACLIAILGGIFLGSDALIIIFVLVMFSKILLMHEVAELKDNLKN
jgi:Ca2+/Na+ antiporter